jgi:hypothetical protein
VADINNISTLSVTVVTDYLLFQLRSAHLVMVGHANPTEAATAAAVIVTRNITL